MCVLSCFSCIWLLTTLWTVAQQPPLSMGFSRQEYWSGLPYPPPRDLPDPGIEPVSLMSPALAGRFFTTSITWKASQRHTFYFFKKLAFVPEFAVWNIKKKKRKKFTFEYMYDCFSNLQFYLLFYFPLFALIIFCCFKKKFSWIHR